MRSFESDMREYRFFVFKRDDPEPNALVALADFLRVETAGWQPKLIGNTFYQRRLATSRTTSKQNLFLYVIVRISLTPGFSAALIKSASGNAHRTRSSAHRLLPIAVCVRNAGIFQPFHDASEATISAND